MTPPGKQGPIGPSDEILVLRPRPRWYRRALAIGAVVLVLLWLPVLALRLTDWLWFRELGLERVFFTKIVAQWALTPAVSVLVFALFWLNIRLARPDIVVAAERARPAVGVNPAWRAYAALALPIAAVVALLFGLGAASRWVDVLQWVNGVPFGERDPIFGRDLGYYVFALPVVQGAIDLLTDAILAAAFLLVLPIYASEGDFSARGRVHVAPRAARHLALLGAAYLVAAALETHFVRVPSVLFGANPSFVGASYTDLHAKLPALHLVSVLALVAAAALVFGTRRGRLLRSAVIIVAGYAALNLLAVGIFPAMVRRLVVQPNELAREAPQIAHHLKATRRAWGLERVVTRELNGEIPLTLREVEANRATIRNVRLWDREPLLQTYGQLQSIRTYYEFINVDDDRYRIDGEYRQVLLSARELDPANLPTRSFINEHLTFTHGMGLTLGPSNQVSDEGLPVLFIKDLPPASTVSLAVTRPQIYYGELSNDFVLVKTRQREFDVPAAGGAADRYTTYAGAGGVPVGSLVRRLLFAARFGSLNILLSGDIAPESRILFRRSVAERAQAALPFLRFDQDPYLVITDAGHLVWILDGYTSSARYPYAQPIADGTNYLRNSAKVTIDAYDGTLAAYLADPADPVIRTWANIYPNVFRPLAQMPADLRAHLRYPTDLFHAQTALYATYHMEQPEEYYQRLDQWQVPASAQPTKPDPFLRHIVMRLPGEAEPEFILMTPFTPRQKDNLAAWMVARNDGAHYGELVSYRFPRQSLVYGPKQVVNRINQDTDVSRQTSLWDQRGSKVIWGDLLVIPIEQALIYVQPLYLQAEGGRIPELKRVVVAYQNHVVMDSTLEAGLAQMFGGAASTLAAAPGDTAGAPARPSTAERADSARATPGSPNAGAAPDARTAELIRSASEHYRRAIEAQRAGNWSRYGAEIDSVGRLLERLRRP